MIAHTVNVDAFKALLGKEQWSDEEFSGWVKSEVESNIKSEGTVELKELSEQEGKSLIDSIDSLEGYRVRLEQG